VTHERGRIALPGVKTSKVRTRESAVLNEDRESIAAESDSELFQRVRDRDERALAELYDRHAGLVLTVALRVVGDRELAEEVLQDTFLRCWTGAASYEPARGKVLGWLTGIARNRSIDVLRSRQHRTRVRERNSLPEADDSGLFSQADETEAVAMREVVTQAMNGLPLVQRQVVELAYYGGMSQTEIAAATGEPLGTVKSRTRMAMEHLRGQLRPQLRPDGGVRR
jgi:RNA polymerase sigma-70 factor, ECF subfamily